MTCITKQHEQWDIPNYLITWCLCQYVLYQRSLEEYHNGWTTISCRLRLFLLRRGSGSLLLRIGKDVDNIHIYWSLNKHSNCSRILRVDAWQNTTMPRCSKTASIGWIHGYLFLWGSTEINQQIHMICSYQEYLVPLGNKSLAHCMLSSLWGSKLSIN
jgi:hypothetical protein